MGILNVNADSFSDPRAAVEQDDTASLVARGRALSDAGAAVVDVGAESASPATQKVDASAEIDALVPVLTGLRDSGVATSVDTYKPDVARASLASGASIVNDYSGLTNPELAGICAEAGARLVLTHNPGGVKNKVLDPDGYTDVVAEVANWFANRLTLIESMGLDREHVLLDPGIDLAKTPAQSIELLRGLPELSGFGLGLLLAISRKDFIGAVSPSFPADRESGSLATIGPLVGIPNVLVRVHDVPAAAQYVAVAAALAGRASVDASLSLPARYRRQAQARPPVSAS